VAFALIDAYS